MVLGAPFMLDMKLYVVVETFKATPATPTRAISAMTKALPDMSTACALTNSREVSINFNRQGLQTLRA